MRRSSILYSQSNLQQTVDARVMSNFTGPYILGAPRGFGDLGRMAIYFQGAGGELVIILGELGSKLIILGI